jgi:hypothetical protein
MLCQSPQPVTRSGRFTHRYAARILAFSDEITRKTLPALGPAQPAASNIISLALR